MLICVPTTEDRGLDSPVCEHFGSAPIFLLIDSESGACRAVTNTNSAHAHGMCQPLSLLANEPIDALVVGGIGRGALMKLKAARIGVYRSSFPTVKETLDALKAGSLQAVTPEMTCAGHGGGGCH